MNASVKVLFVDDEPNVLEGIQRGLRKRVELMTAQGGNEGLKLVKEAGPFAAINEGHIFRFLSKPCPIDRLWEGVAAGIEQYRLLTAERALLEHTLSGAAKMLVEILGMVSPAASSRANRLQQYVRAMSAAVGTSERWQLPLAAIPRLDDVAAIVAAQRGPPGPTVGPSDPCSWDINRLGQMLLHAASEFDRQLSRGVRVAVALESLRAASLGLTTPMIEALRNIPAETDKTVQRMVPVGELTIGMVFEEDVMSAKGMRLVPAAHEVTASLLARLHSIAAGVGIVEPMRVRTYA